MVLCQGYHSVVTSRLSYSNLACHLYVTYGVSFASTLLTIVVWATRVAAPQRRWATNQIGGLGGGELVNTSLKRTYGERAPTSARRLRAVPYMIREQTRLDTDNIYMIHPRGRLMFNPRSYNHDFA